MNRIVELLLVVLLPLSVVACSNSSSPQKDEAVISPEENPIVPEDTLAQAEALSPEEKPIEGMIKVSATGKVLVGTNSAEAKLNEKPEMRVSLDYDFYMDVHEATCGEYKSLSKFLGSRRYSCNGDSLPLTAVTYYDAVLFANARSLRDKYDTVYSYVSASFDEENHCVFLEGLNYHPENEGYRLPTEAEWIRAASEGWNAENSWNADNSGYKVHEVCSKDVDSLGFCDFSGNVMEWVSDFLGKFKDTTITNYMGSLDGGTVGERVVKGGSYRLSKSSIHLYSRGDVYMVTSTSSGDYLGFRLALGRIENPVWFNRDGSVERSKMTVIASVMSVRGVVGSFNAKLAFRDDVTGDLAYVDYVDGGNSVVVIQDTLNVYHPEISPDGEYVAFCTKPEGVSGKSELFVRHLDATGSGLVKLEVSSAAIPRWHVSDAGDTCIVYVTDAGNNKDSSTWMSNSTWRVSFMNGKFGSPEKILDGSFHGGLSENEKLAVTGARLLRARVDGMVQTWLNGEQACNVSLAMDGSMRTLFLDFGSKTGRKFVGESYGVHERILVADSTGNLIWSIGAPQGYSFDHSEWVTDGISSNIVATLTNINGAHDQIVLVNAADSSIVALVEGDELWHPSLWVKKKAPSVTIKSSSSQAVLSSSSESENGSSQDSTLLKSSSSEESSASDEIEFELDPDSAGIYYLPGGSEEAAISRYKMELLWNYRNSADVVILGSSRAYYGVDPTVFSDKFNAVNLAMPANNFAGAKFYFDNYVFPHMKKMKYLIVSLDLDRGYNTLKTSSFYRTREKYIGYSYDEKHDYWKQGVPSGLLDASVAAPGVSRYANMLRPTRGHEAKIVANGWQGENPSVATDSTWFDQTPELYYDNFNQLIDLVKTAEDKGVYVVGVIFPMAPGFKNTGSFGCRGIRRSVAPSLIQELADISKTYSNFILFDENKMGNHDYTDDMALDNNHLVHAGAVQMTERLDSLLKTLE